MVLNDKFYQSLQISFLALFHGPFLIALASAVTWCKSVIRARCSTFAVSVTATTTANKHNNGAKQNKKSEIGVVEFTGG